MTVRHLNSAGVRWAKSVSVGLGSGGPSLALPGASGAEEAVAPSSRSAFFSGTLPSCAGCGNVSRGGDLPPNHVDGLEKENPDIFAGISRGSAGRRDLPYLTHTFSMTHMLTLRARGRAENGPYLYILVTSNFRLAQTQSLHGVRCGLSARQCNGNLRMAVRRP